MPRTISSGTRSPRAMYSNAVSKAGLRSPGCKHLDARKTSPVERWQAPSCSQSNCAWVPLPMPGAPSRINRLGRGCRCAGALQRASPPFNHAVRSRIAVILPFIQVEAGRWRWSQPRTTPAGRPSRLPFGTFRPISPDRRDATANNPDVCPPRIHSRSASRSARKVWWRFFTSPSSSDRIESQSRSRGPTNVADYSTIFAFRKIAQNSREDPEHRRDQAGTDPFNHEWTRMNTNHGLPRIFTNFPSSVLCARIVPLNLRDAPSPHPSPPSEGGEGVRRVRRSLGKGGRAGEGESPGEEVSLVGAPPRRVHSCPFVFVRGFHKVASSTPQSTVESSCILCPLMSKDG